MLAKNLKATMSYFCDTIAIFNYNVSTLCDLYNINKTLFKAHPKVRVEQKRLYCPSILSYRHPFPM